MMSAFSFAVERVPVALDVTTLQPYFERLPLDHYIKGSYRRRRLSRFRGPVDKLEHLPHNSFMQSGYVNQLYGNIRRDYEELEDGLINEPSFHALIKSMHDYFKMDPKRCMLGVHQIRITCDHKESGEPAPEGIHQDGFDYLCVCCINRVSVEGAATQFYDDPDKEPLFSSALQPGDIAYVNDRTVYHYTTPIHPAADSGYRDVFVITAKCNVD